MAQHFHSDGTGAEDAAPVHRTVRLIAALVGAISVALLLVACGGGDESASGGVASLDDVTTEGAEVETDDAPATELAADEAALEFSQCMRDEGLDLPDIGLDADGNPDVRAAFIESGIEPGSDEFTAAMETCGELLDGAGFGGGRAGLAEDPAVQDAFVAFSECLRDEGLDVGDLQFGAPADGEGGQRGQGAAQDGFADRDARLAGRLDLDIEDPAVADAISACSPVLDDVLAGFGPGGAAPADG
ncbi:MAG: hypothetical protein AAFZ07_16625 [Actinomycetota bacterium]